MLSRSPAGAQWVRHDAALPHAALAVVGAVTAPTTGPSRARGAAGGSGLGAGAALVGHRQAAGEERQLVGRTEDVDVTRGAAHLVG
jgi:hypothetical protein